MTNLTPSGGDDTKQIQSALVVGNTIDFNPGTFKIAGTLKMVSKITWNADGATFQGGSANMIINDGTIDNINMNGGIYRGDGSTTNRLIEFVCTNSKFSNMTIENTGHCFGITMGSSGNICNKLTAKNSLNGLADRGENNTWNDCTSDSMTSDFFIIKCKNSTFNHCIITAPKVMGAAGFGFYARIDGSNNVGAEISGNKFINCEAHNAGHAGFSLNCPTDGTKAHIHDNNIQAICTGNVQGGLSLVNNSPGGINEKNIFDILANNNPGGGIIIKSGCNNNSGNVVAYSNSSTDITNSGTNSITAFHPLDQPTPKTSGSVTIKNFDCTHQPPNPPFCVQAYCGSSPPPSIQVSLNITPNPANVGDQITFRAIVSGGQSPYTYAWSGRPDVTTDTIVCTTQQTGTFTAGVTVTDSQGKSATDQVQYTVNTPSSTIQVSLQIDPNTIVLGQQSTFTASVTGGTSPYSYTYSNLPAPCKSTNTSIINCTPNSAGDYHITVDITDSSKPPNSASATSQLTVNPPAGQIKVKLEISQKNIKVGQKVTMKTHASGGKKPYSYEYTGLPHPCKSNNKDQIDCRPDQKGNYNIMVTVTDSNKNTGTDTHTLKVT